MTRRVYRWEVPIDDKPHDIGGGPVLHVALRGEPDVVHVWTEELPRQESVWHVPRHVQVFGTGHNLPDGAYHVGSCVAEPFVWHLYAVTL